MAHTTTHRYFTPANEEALCLKHVVISSHAVKCIYHSSLSHPHSSVSTDDDKVVAWHWEEVKGPLREEKVSADTDVLKLTSLVPGNYTFRYMLTPLI